jgi:prophage DNA circulation protein
MEITDIKNPWRKAFQPAYFRGARFHVDTDARKGGRRVALHQYPKRNLPYAEDMGRTAFQIDVQGYLIGPDYLTDMDWLIDALEADGPGELTLPLPYKLQDVTVMVQGYSVTTSREKGGFCSVEMAFVEYGDANFRSTVATPAQVDQAATNVENTVAGTPTATSATEAQPYSAVYNSADVTDVVPNLNMEE